MIPAFVLPRRGRGAILKYIDLDAVADFQAERADAQSRARASILRELLNMEDD